MRIATIASGILLAVITIEPAFAVAPPATTAPGGPALSTPMSTPSGARSPARARPTRKGSMARRAPRAIEPAVATAPNTNSPANAPNVPTVPATPSPPGELNTTTANDTNSAATPVNIAAVLASILAMPENASFRAWYESPHEFSAPRARFRNIAFVAWTDDQSCIVHRDADNKFMRAGCAPAAFRIPSAIDTARADALERHFGFPSAALETIAYRQTPGALAAIEQAVTQTLAQHGITCTVDGIAPDHQWILDQSAQAVRGVAIDIINAYWNNPRTQPSARQSIEALTSYVQNAIPYHKVDDQRNDLVDDGKTRCGLRTPAEALLDGGDCDTKSLLLATLIRSIDTDTPLALVYCMNGNTPHMILAIGCSTNPGEQCITVNNTPMALVESTSDWDIGHVGSTVTIDDAEAVALR
jgi:hypothetical protein